MCVSLLIKRVAGRNSTAAQGNNDTLQQGLHTPHKNNLHPIKQENISQRRYRYFANT